MADELAAASRVSTTPGDLIAGRYVVKAPLGRGGMGAVFRVRDERKGHDLALKRLLLRAERSDLALPLFEREFHTLCELAHPRIVRVYDYGVDDRGAFYTMELLDGEDLQQRGKLPWREACSVLRDVASSLAILHSRKLLHRDPSPRNVRCISDGHAKLIDFGTMTEMGTPKMVAGTPPLVPPEALSQQALDARADLFSLGALAYFTLTGRHAFHAHKLEQLRDLWRVPPPRPAELVSELPPALDELVMSLLELDRGARPGSAAEVIERLCSIAGLPMAEHAAVTEAYLATPRLLGRDALLREVRSALLASLQGRPALLLFEGEPGSGRSRMLDACVLEAKLLGATVARVGADDGEERDYGVLRALLDRLAETLPDAFERALAPRRALLAQLWSDPTKPSAPEEQPEPAARERHRVQAALRDTVLEATAKKRLVVAVDDLDRVDEPSAAVLVALANAGRAHTLSFLFTSAKQDTPSATLGLLSEVATVRTLDPLTAEQTDALLRSVFGEVDRLAGVAARVHELAAGNPGATMELATYMVERGLARYEAGSWTLPRSLSTDELPPTLAAALAARLQTLPESVRDLLEALALGNPPAIPVVEYSALTDHGERASAYQALDIAVAHGVLIPVGQRFRFAHDQWVRQLRAGLGAERARVLHGRLASLAERSGEPMATARHLFEAGETARAVELVLARSKSRDRDRDRSHAMFALLVRACEEAERLPLRPSARSKLKVWLLVMAVFHRDLPTIERYARPMLEVLRRESGLDDWDALKELPESQRLQAALERARQRYDGAPPEQRGLSPFGAISRLAQLMSGLGVLPSMTMDSSLASELPSLEPLCPLAPALELVHQRMRMSAAVWAGRSAEAREIGLRTLERLDQPDRAGLEPLAHQALRVSTLYTLALIEGASGIASAAERVAPFENVPGLRAPAWRTRIVVHLMEGDMVAAKACQRRAELLQLEDGLQFQFPDAGAQCEAYAHWIGEDLIGIKRMTERLELMAQTFPGWSPLVQVSRSHYLRLRGDAWGALQALEPALRATAPGKHWCWPWVAGTHLQALDLLGRGQEAIAIGLDYIASCEREKIAPGYQNIARPLIEALINAGQLEAARSLADRVLADVERAGVTGLVAGAAYEARAKVAAAENDEAAFLLWSERCKGEYLRGNNPALRAKYERLARSAEASALVQPDDMRSTADWTHRLPHKQEADAPQDSEQPVIDTDTGDTLTMPREDGAGVRKGS